MTATRRPPMRMTVPRGTVAMEMTVPRGTVTGRCSAVPAVGFLADRAQQGAAGEPPRVADLAGGDLAFPGKDSHLVADQPQPQRRCLLNDQNLGRASGTLLRRRRTLLAWSDSLGCRTIKPYPSLHSSPLARQCRHGLLVGPAGSNDAERRR